MINKSENNVIKNWKGDISKPLVSICCITYNHENFIVEALDSFLMQETDFPFEIIIRDDASTDDTANIIRKYEKKFPKIIKPICEIENGYSKGIKASPVTFKKAVGEYIALCEGDDYWTDEKKLQIQKDFLDANKKYVITYTGVEAFNENGLIHDYIGGATKDLSVSDLRMSTPINTLTVMFRNVIDKLPTEYNSTKYGDLFLWIILSEYGEGKYLCEIKPSRYRVHSGGIHSGASESVKLENTLLSYSLMSYYCRKYDDPKINEFYQNNISFMIIRNNMSSTLKFFLKNIIKGLIRTINFFKS